MSTRRKPCHEKILQTPPEQTYEPCNGPEHVFEVDMVGELPSTNSFSHIVTATDVFSRYLFAISIRKAYTASSVKALQTIFRKNVFVPQQIITDKGSAFTSILVTKLMDTAGIKIKHATLKHARTMS